MMSPYHRNKHLFCACMIATLLNCINSFQIPSSIPSFRPTSLSAAANEASSSEKPSVAIVGSGAVGAYYGSRLWETGAYRVKYFMRGDHFEASKENGLNVTSVRGDMFVPSDQLEAYDDTKQIGPVDWVVVSLKSSVLNAIPALIEPLLTPGKTRVLVIMNGLIEEDLIVSLKQHVGEDLDDPELKCCAALYGGMALVCCNRLGPGRIDHSYAGLLSSGVAASSLETSDDDNRKAFEDLWGPANVDIAYEPSLLAGRWRKNVWNLPFNGISVAMGGITVDKIVTDPDLRKLAGCVMDETIAAANAELSAAGYDESSFLGESDKKAMFDLSDAMGPYKTSTMLDLTERRSMEVQYLFEKPVERAQRIGVSVPHLETLVAQIKAFQRMYDLF